MKIVKYNEFKELGDPRVAKLNLAKQKYPEITDLSLYELDFIIPYAISEDASLNNLQLLEHTNSIIKAVRDRTIIELMKKRGMLKEAGPGEIIHLTEKETLIKEYLSDFAKLSGLSS